MPNPSIEAIKELRVRTQAGMADCKAALAESDGDMDKAVEILQKKGQARAAKRAGAIATEGEVRAEVFDGGRKAVLVEVNIQTDFAARDDKFKAFVGQVLTAARTAPAGADLHAVEAGGRRLGDVATELTGVLGEKIAVRRWERIEIPSGRHGFAEAYVHFGARIGVLLALEGETEAAASHPAAKTFAEETAMQIAAMAPIALRREEIDAAVVAKQREIFEAQLREEPNPKPESVWPKIIDGRIAKWFAEVALLEQESAQHKKKIDALRGEASVAAGAPVHVTRFVRYELGEGVDKKPGGDLVAGVAELLK
jgi:elongation factor Ts